MGFETGRSESGGVEMSFVLIMDKYLQRTKTRVDDAALKRAMCGLCEGCR